ACADRDDCDGRDHRCRSDASVSVAHFDHPFCLPRAASSFLVKRRMSTWRSSVNVHVTPSGWLFMHCPLEVLFLAESYVYFCPGFSALSLVGSTRNPISAGMPAAAGTMVGRSQL